MLNNCTLLISNKTIFNESYFDGYAFSGNDFIAGNEGYHNFIKCGNDFELNSDGNYLRINKLKDCIIIDRDFHGSYPIFYAKVGARWWVSNSFVKLVSVLKRENVSLTCNFAQLQSWNCDLALSLQACAFETFFKEIKILPSFNFLIIQNGNLEIKSNRKIDSGNYSQALFQMLTTWRARLNALVNCSDIALRLDLTGGVDSRAVFSFFTQDRLLQKGLSKNRIMVFSDRRFKRDYEVASDIANLCNISLNTPLDKIYGTTSQTVREQISNWVNFNIARYSSFVIPPENYSNKKIYFGGEGGEELRYFYGYHNNPPIENFSEYLNLYRQYFSTEKIFDDWKNSIDQSLKQLKKYWGNSIPDSILHYREFRSTYHAIKAPRTQQKIPILASKYAWNLVCQVDHNELVNNQIIFDIINSNFYKLLHIPFDTPEKSITAETLRALKQVQSDFNGAGDVYIGQSNINSNYFEPPVEILLNDQYCENPLSLLINDFDLSVMKDKIVEYCGERFYSKAINRVSELKNSPSSNVHAKGSFLHNLFVLKYLI